MVTVKSVESGDNSFSINHIIDAYQIFYANPTFLNHVHRPEILS